MTIEYEIHFHGEQTRWMAPLRQFDSALPAVGSTIQTQPGSWWEVTHLMHIPSSDPTKALARVPEVFVRQSSAPHHKFPQEN